MERKSCKIINMSLSDWVICALLSCAFLQPVLSGNILVYGIVGSYSQRISMWSMITELADKGHNVTYISAYDSKDPHPKVHDYAPKLWKEAMGPWEEHMSFYDIRRDGKMVNMWFNLPAVGLMACEKLYSDSEFVSWLNRSRFDVVIVDSLMNECSYGLVHYFKAKLINYCTFKPMGYEFDAHGLPDETSSVTDIMFNFPPGRKMTFLQRFVNAVSPLVWKVFREYWYLPQIEAISKKGLGLEDIPPFTEIERNASLLFLTTHYSLDYPRSLPPHTIPVGGVAVPKKQKPVPKEFEDFINTGKEGFILISFGTVAEFTNFDKSVRLEFINAVSKFPNIRFVWKSSYIIQEPLPDNVFEVAWAPQQSLLAHPKIRAFISHSGMGSTTEAVHFAVPVISCPILAEQDMNADAVTSRGAGIKLEITTLKQHELENAIYEILNNPTYRLRMNKLSEIYKDRQTSAVENAVWWTEYILRHNDTNEFLHPPNLQQPWWIKRQIDVWVFATFLTLLLISAPIYLSFIVIKRLFVVQSDSENSVKQKVQ